MFLILSNVDLIRFITSSILTAERLSPDAISVALRHKRVQKGMDAEPVDFSIAIAQDVFFAISTPTIRVSEVIA